VLTAFNEGHHECVIAYGDNQEKIFNNKFEADGISI
jgi:hypothetical protein